jgi:MoaA/NifB/PqqE/SkfB family radical SAM enzyme
VKPTMFAKVLRGLKQLCAAKKADPRIHVEIIFIVMRQNLAEVPALLRLCEDLGVDQVFLRTLRPVPELPSNLQYGQLPPYLHPEFASLREGAVQAIKGTTVKVVAFPDTWGDPILIGDQLRKTPPACSAPEEIPMNPEELSAVVVSNQIQGAEDSLHTAVSLSPDVPGLLPDSENRLAPFFCAEPYTSLYVGSLDGHVNPCCYMEQIPGYEVLHLNTEWNTDEIWNSPQMVTVRERLRQGPLIRNCLTCPFYW